MNFTELGNEPIENVFCGNGFAQIFDNGIVILYICSKPPRMKDHGDASALTYSPLKLPETGALKTADTSLVQIEA